MADRITQPTFDHVALASRHVWDNLIRYAYHLGARWMGGSDDYETDPEDDFYFAQVECQGGTKLEFIQAMPGEASEFIRRFLHRNGPGPHHLTFKVPDLDEAIAAAEADGYAVVGINRASETWQEAFLHPTQSHGIVIQFACQGGEPDEWVVPPALPPARQGLPVLEKVVHLVADLDGATALFTDQLAMTEIGRGEGRLGEYVRLGQGPWVLELLHPTRGSGPHHWLGKRPGRILQLCMQVDDPASVPDATRLRGDVFELHPDINHGTRVLLRPHDADPAP